MFKFLTTKLLKVKSLCNKRDSLFENVGFYGP